MSDPGSPGAGGDAASISTSPPSSPTTRLKKRSSMRRAPSFASPRDPAPSSPHAFPDTEYPVTTAEGPDRLLAKFYAGTSGPMASPEGERARRKVSLRHPNPENRPDDAAVDELPLQQRVRARHSLASLRGIVSNLPALPEVGDRVIDKIDLGSADGKAWVRKVLKLYDGRVTALERELLDLIEVAGEAAELRRQVAAEKEKAKEMDHAMQSLMPLNFLNQANKTEVGPAMAKITEADLGVMRVELEKTKRELEMTRGRMRGCEAQVEAMDKARMAAEERLAGCERELVVVREAKAKATEEADVLTEKMRNFELRVKHECELEMDRHKKMMQEMRTKNRNLADAHKALKEDKRKLEGTNETLRQKLLGMETEHARALHERDNAAFAIRQHDADQMAALEAIWKQLERVRQPDAFAHLLPELASPSKLLASKAKRRASLAGVKGKVQSFSKKRKSDVTGMVSDAAGKAELAAKPDAASKAEGAVKPSVAALVLTLAAKEDKDEGVRAPPLVALDASGHSAADLAENDTFASSGRSTRAEMISTSIARLFKQNKERGDALEVVERELIAAREEAARLAGEGEAMQGEKDKLKATVVALRRGAPTRSEGTQTGADGEDSPVGHAWKLSTIKADGIWSMGRPVVRDGSPLSPLRTAPRAKGDGDDDTSPRRAGSWLRTSRARELAIVAGVESMDRAHSPKQGPRVLDTSA